MPCSKKGGWVPVFRNEKYSQLATWRNDYPLTLTSKSFVFLTTKKAPIGYAGVAKQLRIIAVKAGVTKHITPHIFRHTRAAHLIQQGYG